LTPHEPFRRVSAFFKERYGYRVQRIPLSIGLGCPNRNAADGKGGCIFCDPKGSGFAALSPDTPLSEQFSFFRQRAVSKYGDQVRFLAYFQSFSNTYAPVETLRAFYDQAIANEKVVALDVSTRPDCVPEEVLQLLQGYRDRVDVYLELGLQTANNATLKLLRRGHSLAQFVDATLRAHAHGLQVVAHVILDLPWDNKADVVETARVLSALQVEGVKCHSLYRVQDTPLDEMVRSGQLQMLSKEEFLDRTVAFLSNLDPNMVIHRLVSDPPMVGATGNWGMTKISLLNEIEKELRRREQWQGKAFHYLNR